MPASLPLMVAAFLMVTSLVFLVSMVLGNRHGRLNTRLSSLSGKGGLPAETVTLKKFGSTALPKVGAPFVPSDEEDRTNLQTRLIRAGLYRRQAMVVFLGAKALLMTAPALLGVAASLTGLVTFQEGVIFGACMGVVGLIGPSFWLDRKRKKRQSNFRRSLPDALDVLVICLEGGLSLPAGLKKITTELRTAHPALASELAIVQREIQLGQTAGEALRKMGERSDLEEVRSMASVILQSEKFGASLVKSLRVHAETLRVKRQQRAEELAQVAGTKMLFPTVLFILPAIFVVILGPAIIHITRAFSHMGF